MFQTWNRKRHARRGVIGIESAIVLIAFVITASALSFVVLNMGFATTQKAKTTISSGLEEASSAMQITGEVTGHGNATANRLTYYQIPVKASPGGGSINLEVDNTAIRYFSKNLAFESIYRGIISDSTYSNSTEALEEAVDQGYINALPGSGLNTTTALVYFTTNKNNNPILDQGENAIIVVAFRDEDRQTSLDVATTEVIVPTGAVLSIKRQVPSISDAIVSMY